MQEQDPLVGLPAALAFFLQNVLQLHQHRWVVLRVDNLVLWKIINEVDAIFKYFTALCEGSHLETHT